MYIVKFILIIAVFVNYTSLAFAVRHDDDEREPLQKKMRTGLVDPRGESSTPSPVQTQVQGISNPGTSEQEDEEQLILRNLIELEYLYPVIFQDINSSLVSEEQKSSAELDENEFWRQSLPEIERIEYEYYSQNESQCSAPRTSQPNNDVLEVACLSSRQKSSGEQGESEYWRQSLPEIERIEDEYYSQKSSQDITLRTSQKNSDVLEAVCSSSSPSTTPPLLVGKDTSREENSDEDDDGLCFISVRQIFSGGGTIGFLNSLQDHRNFIQFAFQRAQQRIIFCSPFLQIASGFERDFTKVRILNSLQKSVKVIFVVEGRAARVNSLKKYLGGIVNHPNFRLVLQDNFHFKTAVVDDFISTQGSFNWFSACRNSRSRYCNEESTLVYKGPGARRFIHEVVQNLCQE